MTRALTKPETQTPSLRTRRLLAFILLAAASATGGVATRASASNGPSSNQFKIVWSDDENDNVVRRTGSLSAPIFDNEIPDLVSLTLRLWQPSSVADPYSGVEVTANNAHVFRLDLVVDGLVNPPGPLALGGNPWDPARFGIQPIYGFIELDVDAQKNSGGELEPVARNRYLANVARLGGLPEGSIGQRAAQSASDYDNMFFTGPQFERTGAEFDLVLCGCFTPTIVAENGNLDGTLDEGETMIVNGRFFERMQAVAPFAGSFGGADFGLYDPNVDLRFSHDVGTGQTTISLVYALDQTGAAMLTGQPEEPMDLSVLNQTSVAEALNDLIFTAEGLFGPITDPAVNELIQPWSGRDPFDSLDVTSWDATALLGTTYTNQTSTLYVWTDLGFNATFGDMNTDGVLDALDQDSINNAIATMDGSIEDADGVVNGAVQIINFGPNFELHDITGDGVIDSADVDAATPPLIGDLNGDGAVDGADLAMLLIQWGLDDTPADLNDDSVVDGADLAVLLINWTG